MKNSMMQKQNIKMIMVAWLVAAMMLQVGAAPCVEITEAWQTNPGSGVVDFTYKVSDLEGMTYDLLVKIGAKGATPVVVTYECVAEGLVTTNINYKQLLGKAYPNVALYASLEVAGVQLWKDGPYWAERNVGATKPEECGYYFWWGDTVGYKRNANNNGWVSVKDSTSFSFSDGNCLTYDKDNSQLLSAGYIDSQGNLVADHDAATVHLGTPWRMPTSDEIQALINNCDRVWTTQDGKKGYLVRGRGNYASKHIFLPAVGYGSGSDLDNADGDGNYWSSTSNLSSTPDWNITRIAMSIYFNVNYFGLYDYIRMRSQGRVVRPVRGFDK